MDTLLAYIKKHDGSMLLESRTDEKTREPFWAVLVWKFGSDDPHDYFEGDTPEEVLKKANDHYREIDRES